MREIFFSNIDWVGLVASAGFPFLVGIYASYKYLVLEKNKNVLLMVCLFLSSLVLLWLRFVKARLAIIFMGAFLAILFAQSLSDFLIFLRKTKLSNYEGTLFVIVAAILFATSGVPCIVGIAKASESDRGDYLDAFSWLSKSTPEDAVIASIPEEGHLITYFSNRKNIVDTEYLLIDDADVISNEISELYNQRFTVGAMRILEKYGSDYIVFSGMAKKKYGIENINYLHDGCFGLIFNKTVEIYQKDAGCGLRKL